MKSMKLFRKSMAAALTLTMAFSMAACGNSGNESKPAEESTAKTQESSDAAQKTEEKGTEATQSEKDPFGAYEDTITLTLARYVDGNGNLPEGATHEDNAYMDWMTERLNIKGIDAFEATGEDYNRQVSLAIASGDLPDCMTVFDTTTLDELVESDLIADLTDVYNDYATDYIKGQYDSFDGRAFTDCIYDGRVMALPSTMPESTGMIWIRQDWMDQLGITIDEDGDSIITKEELEMVATQFVEKNPSNADNPVGIALCAGFGYGQDLSPAALCKLLNAYPGSWLRDESGNAYDGSTAPEMKEALAYMNDLFKKGILDPQFGIRTWDDIMALLTNGQTGIAFGEWHFPDWALNNVKGMDPGAEFSPYMLDNGTGKTNWLHSNAANRYVVVSKECEHPEAVIKIMNLFYDETKNANLKETAPEVYEYGSVLGVSNSERPLYMEVESANGIIEEQYRLPQRYLDGEVALEDLSDTSRTFAESFSRYLDDPENASVQDWAGYHSRVKGLGLLNKVKNQNLINDVIPFFPANTETMNSNLADMQKLRDETLIKIVVGELPIDAFDSFVEEWNERGGTQITAELAQ